MGTTILTVSMISLVFGLMVLFAPQRVARISETVDRLTFDLDRKISKYHVGVGIFLILAGIFLFSYGYLLGGR